MILIIPVMQMTTFELRQPAHLATHQSDRWNGIDRNVNVKHIFAAL